MNYFIVITLTPAAVIIDQAPQYWPRCCVCAKKPSADETHEQKQKVSPRSVCGRGCP
jgi:hypothetical protein